MKRIPPFSTFNPQYNINNMSEETKGKYFLKIKVNDKVTEVETEDLKESILEAAPRFVKTKVHIIVEKPDGKKYEKILFVNDAKQLFRNDIYMNFFLNHMIFK